MLRCLSDRLRTTTRQRQAMPAHSSRRPTTAPRRAGSAAVVVLGLLACCSGGMAAARVGCRSNSDCDGGYFCHLPDTTCAPPGVCEPTPEVCTMEYAPVCGCDGVTYGSRCTAFGRGVSYRSVGECDPSPSQQQPEPQPAVPADVSVQQKDSGGKRRGLGWKDISSAFAASAEFLRNKQQPAMEEGLGLASSSAVNGGETTRVRCGSRGLAPCEEGYFCEFVDGLCGETDTGGFCTHRKLACNKIYRPVCGCDAVTYPNACVARSQGISLRHEGQCDPTVVEPMVEEPAAVEQEEQPSYCGGLMGRACAAGQACIYAMEAMCGAADMTGVCMTPPSFCTLNYQPVCGCDGNTYSNMCHAHAKGVSVVSEGPCNAPRTPEEAEEQEIAQKDAMLAHLDAGGDD